MIRRGKKNNNVIVGNLDEQARQVSEDIMQFERRQLRDGQHVVEKGNRSKSAKRRR
jgi:hypothetical protein